MLFSCNGQDDDKFRPCFDCEGFEARNVYGGSFSDPIEYKYTSRQSEESFKATLRSERVVCRIGLSGQVVDCRLRVDRIMQLRGRSFERALEFVQSEQYLSQEDIDLLFRNFYTWTF